MPDRTAEMVRRAVRLSPEAQAGARAPRAQAAPGASHPHWDCEAAGSLGQGGGTIFGGGGGGGYYGGGGGGQVDVDDNGDYSAAGGGGGGSNLVPAGGTASVSGGASSIVISYRTSPADADLDGVPDADDVCAGTMLPDEPLVELKRNRFAANDSGEFVDGTGRSAGLTLMDTAGCSAAQVIAAAGLGAGHSKFGISKGELMAWANQ